MHRRRDRFRSGQGQGQGQGHLQQGHGHGHGHGRTHMRRHADTTHSQRDPASSGLVRAPARARCHSARTWRGSPVPRLSSPRAPPRASCTRGCRSTTTSRLRPRPPAEKRSPPPPHSAAARTRASARRVAGVNCAPHRAYEAGVHALRMGVFATVVGVAPGVVRDRLRQRRASRECPGGGRRCVQRGRGSCVRRSAAALMGERPILRAVLPVCGDLRAPARTQDRVTPRGFRILAFLLSFGFLRDGLRAKQGNTGFPRHIQVNARNVRFSTTRCPDGAGD